MMQADKENSKKLVSLFHNFLFRAQHYKTFYNSNL
jgi:hypothetical protein